MRSIHLILLAALGLVLASCKKDDIPKLTEKQRLALGKWEQIGFWSIEEDPNRQNNLLESCAQGEQKNIFELRADGRYYYYRSPNCAGNSEPVVGSYAFSGDGNLLVLDRIYYVSRINNQEMEFWTEPSMDRGIVQLWRRKR